MQVDSNNRWVELVSKLIALTQDGVLQWSKSEKTVNAASTFFVVNVETYTALHKGKKIVLTAKLQQPLARQFKLEIAGEDDVSLFEIPITNGISDLYDAVRYSASGVKQFIDDLLAD